MFSFVTRMRSMSLVLCILVACICSFSAPTARAYVDNPPTHAVAITPILPGHVPHPILGDLRVRQALAHCTDRAALVAAVYPDLDSAQRASLLSDSFLLPDSWAYNGAFITYTHNITLANQLLTQAGWTLAAGDIYRRNSKGQTLELSFKATNTSLRRTYGDLWRDQLAQCGILLIPAYMSSSLLYGDDLPHRRYETAGFAWAADTTLFGQQEYGCTQIPTPANGWQGQNWLGYCNPQIEQKINQATYLLSRADRLALYQEIQAGIAADVPFLPLFSHAGVAASRHVTGFLPTTAEPIYTWNAAQWQKGLSDTIRMAMTNDPESLCCFWDGWVNQRLLIELIYGGWSTTLNFEHQPRYYTAIPTIENGGVVTRAVNVTEGMQVVDYYQNPRTLNLFTEIADTAGNKVVYAGGAISMTQVTITTSFVSGLKWSDGSDLIQADLRLWDRIRCDPDIDYGDTCDWIASTQYVTDTTVGYTMLPGYAPAYPFARHHLPGAFPSQRIVTGGVKLEEVPVADFLSLPEIRDNPMGFGPYMLVDWQKGVSMTLTANPHHALGAPLTPNIEVVFISSDEVVAQLQDGSIDVIGPESAPLEVASSTGDFAAFIVPANVWEHADMNLSLQFYLRMPVVLHDE